MLTFLALAFADVTHAQRQTSRSPHGSLNIPCDNCHTSTGWRPIRAIPEFNHDSTRYPLRGLHEKVPCTGCHLKPVFTDVGKNCSDCHADIHRRQMGANCAQCHTVNGWQVTTQSISQHTNRFPLLGAHAVVECQECHKTAAAGQYLGLSTACESCHMSDYQNTTTPVHKTAGSAFAPSNCSNCHGFDSWTNAKIGGQNFDHAAFGFPLTLGHANVPCASCHINNNYSLTIAATDCGNAQCHLTTWQQTNNPVHSSAGTTFAATNCSNCHTPAGWTVASFDHSVTGFTLTGTHMSPNPTPCASCHLNNNYTLNSADCYGCHQAAFASTVNMGGSVPNHIAAGFPTTATACASCHPISTWSAGSFNHSAFGFPLTNGHANVACSLCHINNNYSLNSTACYPCHVTQWQSTTTIGGTVPNHVTLGFPTDCSACHSTVNWTSATFNHNNTPFPLTGAHINVACNLCHTSSAPPATDCYSCHIAQWQSTTQLGGSVPNHIAMGYPTTCASCHNTTSWLGATFNHNATAFPLTGAHINVACNLCHTNSTPPPTDCYSCHVAQWQSTVNWGGNVPNHIAAAFPTTCATCHTTTNWLGATFSHTWWNPMHGNANGICGTCHTTSSNYAVFVCSNGACHPKSSVDQIHQGNPSYVYSTGATCYTCHGH